MTEVGVVVGAQHADVLAYFGNQSKTIYIDDDEEVGKSSLEMMHGLKSVDDITTNQDHSEYKAAGVDVIEMDSALAL